MSSAHNAYVRFKVKVYWSAFQTFQNEEVSKNAFKMHPFLIQFLF